MTREEAINQLQDAKDGYEEYLTAEAIDMAIQALSQEPCDDAVSRKAVLDLIADYDLSMGQVVKGIHALPSVTQKSGKWIDREEYDADRWKCSICGRTEQYQERYCPNCGARMESEQNE